MKTREIRAHHVGTAKALYLLPKQTIIETLINSGYIKTPEHDFVNFIYSYKKLFNNSNQKFRIKIEGLDFICENCPKYKNQTCDPLNPKKIIGSAFLISPEKRLTDLQVAKKYNLKEGQIYTAEELRKKAKF